MKPAKPLLMAFLLSACTHGVPYEPKHSSRIHKLLTHASFLASNGNTYSTRGFIELFAPNYYVLVGSPRNKTLVGDFEGARLAAQEVVETFDCEKGSIVKSGSMFSYATNEWLIVVDCDGRPRSLSG